MRSLPGPPDIVSPPVRPSMQSLPRPPSSLSAPPRPMIRSAMLVPVMRSALFVPTIANFGAPLPLRHGLRPYSLRATSIGTTLPPLGPEYGGPTMMSPWLEPLVAARMTQTFAAPSYSEPAGQGFFADPSPSCALGSQTAPS